MIPSARIHRGLHRVGAVLAALVILQGGRGIAPALIAVAALVYAAARAVGWVLVGFIGTDGMPSP